MGEAAGMDGWDVGESSKSALATDRAKQAVAVIVVWVLIWFADDDTDIPSGCFYDAAVRRESCGGHADGILPI